MGVKVVAFAKVPVPVWVHSKLLKLLADAGVACVLKLNTVPWHTSWLLPALTTTAGVMVRSI